MHRRLALAIFTAFPALALAAAREPGAASAPEPAVCDLAVYSTGQTPEQLEVHAGPGADTPVVARMPAPIQDEGWTIGAEMTVTAARDGWLQVEDVIFDDYVSDAEPQVVYAGRGWVPGQFLGVWVESPVLRQTPSEQAAVSARLTGTDGDGVEGADAFDLERLIDCRGGWVEVEGTFLGKRVRGWSGDVCANQVTTCP